MISLNYNILIKNYNKILTSTTRGFDNEFLFLESWVPRENLNDSVSDLLNAALDYNVNDVCIKFDLDQIKKIDLELIRNNLKIQVNYFSENDIRFSKTTKNV
jgi:hypothetical protein